MDESTSGGGAMPDRFAPERRRALRDLLGLTAASGAGPLPRGGRLEIAAVREALGLPEPPCRAWLAPDRWLLGGAALVAIDLLSPDGEVFQLAAIAFEPSLDRLTALGDYSVCQLGLDDRDLYFGRHTWSDLFSGRLRMENLDRRCYVRLRKYMKKG